MEGPSDIAVVYHMSGPTTGVGSQLLTAVVASSYSRVLGDRRKLAGGLFQSGRCAFGFDRQPSSGREDWKRDLATVSAVVRVVRPVKRCIRLGRPFRAAL